MARKWHLVESRQLFVRRGGLIWHGERIFLKEFDLKFSTLLLPRQFFWTPHLFNILWITWAVHYKHIVTPPGATLCPRASQQHLLRVGKQFFSGLSHRYSSILWGVHCCEITHSQKLTFRLLVTVPVVFSLIHFKGKKKIILKCFFFCFCLQSNQLYPCKCTRMCYLIFFLYFVQKFITWECNFLFEIINAFLFKHYVI